MTSFGQDTADAVPYALPESYQAFAAEELKKPVEDRWEPIGKKLASDLYGTAQGKTCLVLGTGDSLDKHLNTITQADVLKIAVNGAITKVKADYWLFTDYDAFLKWGREPNAVGAIRLGVDRFATLYDDSVHVWRRGFSQEAIVNGGRLFHQNTSVLPALDFAFRLGCKRVITCGLDCYIKPGKIIDQSLIDRWGSYNQYITVMNFTFARIMLSIKYTLKYWKPEDAVLLDASWGRLPCDKVNLREELVKSGCIISAKNKA